MTEEKDLKQRVLARARERHLEESVVGCILDLIQSEKQKLPDLLKAFDFLQSLEKEDAPADTLLEDLNVEDMSQYTEAELRRIQAQLERYLKGGLDGDEKEPPPGTEAPPTDRQRTDGRRPPSGTPKPESSGTPGINLELGDFLHG